jgi:hypothetical protein
MRNTLTVVVGEPEGKRTLESNTLINYMWGWGCKLCSNDPQQ